MNKFKRIIILIALPLSGGVGGGLFAQSVQRGVVMEYRSEKAKAPLSGVAISAANAGSTVSDAEGRFTLNFRTLKAGDAIQFRRIEKAGFEIMNREALDVAKVFRNNVMTEERDNENSKTRNFELSIILCRTALLNEIRDGYRSVTVRRYEKQLKEKEAEIERLRKEGRLKEEEYNERLDALEAEFEEKLSNIETYIDRFARIDMTALSEAESQTIKLVQEGRFEEAIANYESQDLVELLNKTRVERKQLKEAAEAIEATIASKEEENEKLRQSISRQIDLLHLAGGPENMEKIHQILREVYMADTTDIAALREYANALYEQDRTEESAALLRRGMTICDDDFTKALIALDIATYTLDIAATAFADSIAERIKTTDHRATSRLMPASAYLQIDNLLVSGKTADCQPIIKKMEAEWAPDTLDTRSLMHYCRLLRRMSDYYSLTGSDRAAWAASEIVRLDEKIYAKQPWLSLLEESYATVCDNLFYKGDFESSRDFAMKAIAIAEEQTTKNPAVRSHHACNAAFTVMPPLIEMECFDEAEKVKAFGLANHAKMRLSHRAEIAPLYAYFLLQCSALELHKGDIATAAHHIAEAETLLKAEESEEIALPFRAKLLLKQGEKDEALKTALFAVETAKAQYIAEPDVWNKDTYCCHCITLAEIYSEIGDRKNARRWLRQAEKLVAFESNRIKIKSLTPLTPSPKGEGE